MVIVSEKKKEIKDADWGTEEAGLKKGEIKDLLNKIGERLGYVPVREVHTGFSKVDMTWFDSDIPLVWLEKKKHMEKSIAVPKVGFEIEEKTYVRKTIRGNIDSLNSLSPNLGVLILSSLIRRYTVYNEIFEKVKDKHPNLSKEEMEKKTKGRATNHWKTSLDTFGKFAAASPNTRIVVLTDIELLNFAEGINLSEF